MEETNQILKNSATLRELSRQIDETFKLRDKSAEYRNLWEEACENFHSSFDELFFPGGSNTLNKVKDGDDLAIAVAVDFLVADPIHFRSGYVKEKLWKSAHKWELNEFQKTRLEKAAIAYLSKRLRRDFWYMCRAMARIGTELFWQQVTQILCSQDPIVVKRASYLFAYSLGIVAGERVRKQVYYEQLYRKFG